MSAPAKDGPGVPEEKKGVSKFINRMKTVLKRSDGSKRLSISGKPAAAGSSATNSAVVASAEPTSVAGESKLPEGTRKVLRSQIDAERAKKLAARFNIPLEPLSTGPEKEAYRVEKPIRMRIHRSCHQCGTTFGGNKVCTKCEHTRCKSCPRYPAKKVDGKGKSKAKEPLKEGAIEVDTYYGLRDLPILTKPNPKTGGQPLVHKKPHQRVRRNCHLCSALFTNGSKLCSGCGHVRCADCPRDPAKKNKYPDGYPGDAPSSDTSRPVKFACHKCTKIFPAVPHPSTPEGIAFIESGPLNCVRCNHAKCDECPRAAPQKVEPTPDPEVLKSVQAKLSALNIKTAEA